MPLADSLTGRGEGRGGWKTGLELEVARTWAVTVSVSELGNAKSSSVAITSKVYMDCSKLPDTLMAPVAAST